MVTVDRSDHDPAAPATLDALQRSVGDADRRILVRGATVLSMDPEVGDFACADVLVRGRHIAAVGPEVGALAGEGAIVVDASGMIVMPGMHDTHRHCWQGQLRRLIAGADLAEYIATVHLNIGPHYLPEDVYAGGLISALGALDSGVTSVLDFSHNSRSDRHSDAALQASADAGIRTVHAYGPPLVGEWDRQWPQDVLRLQATYSGHSHPLTTMRLAVYGSTDLGGPTVALTPETVSFARGLGIGIVADAVFGPVASDMVVQLGRAGLLGPDVTLIHCTGISDEAWDLIAESGTQVSLCPTSDPQVGCMSAVPPIQRALDHGVRPGLSVDVECCLSTSMFAQMQAVYTIQRMGVFSRRFDGAPAPAPLSIRETLLMATAYGASVNGLGDTVGTLTPGKEADLVFIDAEDWNTTPLNHAMGTVVLGADTRNVDSVFVAGDARKWRGTMVGHDLAAVRATVAASRDRLLAASGLDLGIFR